MNVGDRSGRGKCRLLPVPRENQTCKLHGPYGPKLLIITLVKYASTFLLTLYEGVFVFLDFKVSSLPFILEAYGVGVK